MGDPIRHHYVPRFYLARFCASGTNTLHLFDRERSHFRYQRPEEVAHRRNYYAFTDEGGKLDLRVEHYLSEVESLAKLAIEKIDRAEGIEGEEAMNLAAFIGLQSTRTPTFEAKRDAMHTAISDAILEKAFQGNREEFARYLQHADPEKVLDHSTGYPIPDKRRALADIVPFAREFAEHLVTMDWYFLRARPKKSFVTSDHPLVVLPPAGWDAHGVRGYGFKTAGVSIVMPLSAQTCLLAQGRGDRISFTEAEDAWIRDINLRLAESCNTLLIARDSALLHSLVKETGINEKKWDHGFQMGV